MLLPPSLEELIEPDHPVRVVNEVIERINLEPLLAAYKPGGTSVYHPRMLLKVLVYGYLSNIFSSRKIEQALRENIHFMWLSAMNRPDHNTIARFRSERLKGVLRLIFGQIVELLMEEGVLSIKDIYTDGTRIEANANRYTFVWAKSIRTNKERIARQLDELWQYTQKVAEEELAEEDEVDFRQIDSKKVEQVVEKIDKALKGRKVPKKVREKLYRAKKHWPGKMAEYEQKEKILDGRRSYSKTDPDATFMGMKEDHYGNAQLKPAYNWQVSTTDQYIVNYTIHQSPGDTLMFKPHMENFEDLYGRYPEAVTADGAYGNQENYEYLEQHGIDNYVKYNNFHKEQQKKFRQDPFPTVNLYYNKEQDKVYCPMGQAMDRIADGERWSRSGYKQVYARYQARNCYGCPLRGPCHKGKGNRIVSINHHLQRYRKKARENLLSEQGIMHRKKRPADVEATFGIIKHNKGFRRFMLRGLEKVEIEAGLLAISHNLAKRAAA